MQMPGVSRSILAWEGSARILGGRLVFAQSCRTSPRPKGLEWRDAKGLTPTELRIMEDRLAAAMLSPVPPMIVADGR